MALSLDDAIGQLHHRSSTERRSAAKRLRVLCNSAAGPALLDALREEVTDSRTWETQYQMIMALGTCEHAPAVVLLEELAREQKGYEMVGVAIGDALTRIEWATSKTLAVVDRSMTDAAPGVIDGSFRAMAMLQLNPVGDLPERIIAYVTSRPLNDGLRYWVAAAAATWQSPAVEAFLQSCLTSSRSELANIAATSLSGTHIQHRVL